MFSYCFGEQWVFLRLNVFYFVKYWLLMHKKWLKIPFQLKKTLFAQKIKQTVNCKKYAYFHLVRSLFWKGLLLKDYLLIGIEIVEKNTISKHYRHILFIIKGQKLVLSLVKKCPLNTSLSHGLNNNKTMYDWFPGEE